MQCPMCKKELNIAILPKKDQPKNEQLDKDKYYCSKCKKWFINNHSQLNCLVEHLPGQCCHFGDTEIKDQPKEIPEVPKKILEPIGFTGEWELNSIHQLIDCVRDLQEKVKWLIKGNEQKARRLNKIEDKIERK